MFAVAYRLQKELIDDICKRCGKLDNAGYVSNIVGLLYECPEFDCQNVESEISFGNIEGENLILRKLKKIGADTPRPKK